MGLDQYIYKNSKNQNNNSKTIAEEFHSWRKNNQIQGWFEDNYQIDNLEEVEIDIECCEKMIKDLKSGLPLTTGFFYGNEIMDEDEVEETIKLFEEIKYDLEHNDSEYVYSCWY